jgi:hypothetical protein
MEARAPIRLWVMHERTSQFMESTVVTMFNSPMLPPSSWVLTLRIAYADLRV